jgi:hypothetical protein
MRTGTGCLAGLGGAPGKRQRDLVSWLAGKPRRQFARLGRAAQDQDFVGHHVF